MSYKGYPREDLMVMILICANENIIVRENGSISGKQPFRIQLWQLFSKHNK